MLRRIWYFLTDSRNLTILGFAALAVFLYLGAEALEVALVWALALLLLAFVTWLGLWLWRRRRARRDAQALGQAILNEAEIAAAQAASAASSTQQGDLDAVRTGLLDAIETIKTSKLGLKSGAAALYELPWYMIIGNPAAGKSSAILHSGLQFPFADGKIVQGVGGTRGNERGH